jgi:type II secretory pathway component GspD/PulD (secretin)
MWPAVVVILAVASQWARAGESPESQAAEAATKRLLLHLSSVPAEDAANALRQVFLPTGPSEPKLIIGAEATSNSLILAGPASAVAEASRLVDELDRPAALVHLELLIGDAPVDAVKPAPAGDRQAATEGAVRVIEKPEKLEVHFQAKFSTINQQPVHLQMGRREPHVTGTSTSPRGTARTVEYENTGTLIEVTPRVDVDDTIVVEIKVEDSRLGSPDEGIVIAASSEGESIKAPSVETWTMQTTLNVASGKSVVVAAAVRNPQTKVGRVMLLTARIERIGR